MHLFHKFVSMPISLGLMKREVVARRSCAVCGRTFIQKPWYVNLLGCRKWMETLRLDIAEVNCHNNQQLKDSIPLLQEAARLLSLDYLDCNDAKKCAGDINAVIAVLESI